MSRKAIVCLPVLFSFLVPSACVIPTPAELEAAAAAETTVQEDVPADAAPVPEPDAAVQPEVVEVEAEGPPLFGPQALVDLKDANPIRFNRDWGGREVRVVGILADIDFARSDQIRIKLNESGTDYIIGVNCILARSEAADEAVAALDRGAEIAIAGLVVARDDWMLELEPCGLLEPVSEASP